MWEKQILYPLVLIYFDLVLYALNYSALFCVRELEFWKRAFENSKILMLQVCEIAHKIQHISSL